jgi:hypothetical protein
MDNPQPIKKPNILLYDLEVSPELFWGYPPRWQTMALKVEQRQKLMSFSYKWLGEKKIYHENLSKMKGYNRDPQNDKALTKELHNVMSSADVIIGHNSVSFDDKMANMFFVSNGLDPLPSHKVIDTKRIAKQYFRYGSNKLDDLADHFGLKGKTDIRHSDIWYECFMEKSKRHWKLMKFYNDQDVRTTEEIYMIMRPFMRNHPALSRITNDFESCPRCGSFDYRVKAYRTTNVSRYHQYFCNNCRGYFSDRKAISEKEGDVKPSFVNV